MKKITLLFFALLMSAASWQGTAQTYCLPTISTVEPITSVVFAGINNISPATGGPGYQNFTGIIGNVVPGESKTITLKGNTNGSFTCYFTVFIDWNQNGTLDNPGEMFQIGSINTSTGTDAKFVSGTIVVPSNALVGQTRMRVIKNFNSSPILPCGTYSYGQAEDYTIQVGTLVNCQGVPTAGTVSPNINVCAGTAFSVNVSGATAPAGGLVRIWQSSPSGQNIWTDIVGAASPTYATTSGVSVPTDFRYKVTCTISNETDFSGVVSVSLNPGNQCYCTPVYSTGCSSGDRISNVSLVGESATLNNSSQCSANSYGNYTALTPADLAPGETYTLSVSTDYSSPTSEQVRAWIDYNEDGQFTANEEIANTGGTGLPGGTRTFDFTVPETVGPGNYRMRVRLGYGSSAPTFDACSSATWGEAEDYTVQIIQLDVCQGAPTAGVIIGDFSVCGGIAFDVSVTGATDPAGGLERIWQSSPTGDNAWTDIVGAASASYTVIGGIAAPTDFRYKVTCTFSNETDISGVVSVSLNPGSQCYCQPQTNSTYYINSFSTTEGVQNINNTISSAPAGGYGNFTSQRVSQVQTIAVNFSASMNLSTHGMKIWVDWNQDGSFSAGEIAYQSPGYLGTFTGSILVPSNALEGTTRMRVGTHLSNSSGPATPCEVGTSINIAYQDYSFEVIQLEPCTGADAGTVVGDIAREVCSNSPFSLSVIGNSEVAAGLVSSWQSSPAGQGIWTNLNISSSTINLAPISMATDYRFHVECGSNVDNSQVISVTINPNPAACPCIPQGTNSGRYINNFSTTEGEQNISNLGSGFSTGGYGDFTNMVLESYAGDVINFTADHVGGTFGFRIWVDWNEDGLFDVITEVVYQSTGYGSSHSGSFTVPEGTAIGERRMRIGNNWSGTSGPTDPCVTAYVNGEFEDYTLSVATPTCAKPTDLFVSNLTETAADISWTAGGNELEWEILYGVAGFDPLTQGESFVVEFIPETSLIMLQNSTTYDFYVRAICGPGDNSRWTGPESFGTGCVSIGNFVQKFNTTEVGEVPNCWRILRENSTSATTTLNVVANASAPSAPNDFQFANTTDANAVFYLATPEMTNLSNGNHQLRFFYKGAANTTLQVGTMTDFTNGATFTARETLSTTTTYAEYTTAFVQSSSNARIAFKVSFTNANTRVHLDNVNWETIPNCSKPQGFVVDSMTATTADISWTPGNSQTSWNVSWGTPGFTPSYSGQTGTGISATPTYQIGGLTMNTNYDVYVQGNCTAGGESLWAGPFAIFTGYCGVSTTNGEYLSAVSSLGAVANVIYATSSQPSGSYSNQTSQLFEARATETFQMSTTYVGGTNGVNIWVDWDKNMQFDSSERVASLLSSDATKTLSVNVPAGIPLGEYRMRVRGQWNALPPACGNVNYGSTVDFTLKVLAPPSCPKPIDLAVSNIASQAVDVHWTEQGTASQWKVIYGVSGFNPGTGGSTVTINNTPQATLSNLTANTGYDFYVTAICGVGDESNRVGPKSFRTTCNAVSLPYVMDFESVTVPNLPICTSIENRGVGNNWVTAAFTGGGFSGKVLKYGYNSTNPANAWFYTQGVELIGGTAYQISYMYGNNSTSYSESMKVAYGTSPLASAMINPLADHPSITGLNNATISEVTFVPTADGVYYFGFNAYSAANLLNLYLDNINIDEAPGCPNPSSLIAANVSSSSADISWTPGLNETEWQVIYGVSGFNPLSGGILVPVTNNPETTLTNLTANTKYDFYVTAVCGVGDESGRVGPVSFTTPCAAVSNLFENFEATTGSVFPNCWFKVGATGGAYPQSNTGISGARNLYIYDGATVALPTVNNASAGTHQMVMKVRANFTAGETLILGYLTNPSVASSFVALSSIVVNSVTTPQEFQTIPTGMPSGDVVFALRVGSILKFSVLIDDVSWELIPSCPKPTALMADSFTTNSADISWTAVGNETEWKVIYGAVGFNPLSGGTNLSVGPNPTTTLTGLAHSTNYDVYVKAVCGPNDESTLLGPLTFTTTCGTIASLPYTENFDTYGTGPQAFPSCWSRPVTYTSGTSVWPSIVSGNATSLPNSLKFQSEVGTPTYAVSPSFAEDIHNLRVSFMLKREGTTTNSGTIDVGVMSDPLNLNTFELVQTIQPNNGNYIAYEFDLDATALSGGNNHIALRHNSNSNNYYYWLDDFRVETIPTCEAPTDLALNGISETTADISWTLGNSETAWNISWGIPGYTPGGGGEISTVSVSIETYQITGLTQNTRYDVYVKGVCGPNDESTWTGPLTFTTACDPIASVPYTENFDTYGVGSDAFPSCWSRPVTYTSGSVWPSIVSGNATSSPNSLRFQSAVGTPTYAVSPSFVENIHNLRVSFMLKREGASSGTIEIGVMSNPLDLNTFELVQTINPSNNNHTEYTFDLNATTLAGGNNHIALRHNSSLNNWYYWLDDFRVETIPTCLAPTNLAVIGATENSASITWTLGNSETAWNISWGTPGYTPAAAGELGNASAVMTSYLITGLTADTNYDVYVRANCGAGDLSTWSGPLNVFTGYCTPNLDCTDGDVITNVTFQEINNQTSCSSNGYGDFTTLVANVNAGVTYPISVTVGDGFSAESVSVWIDFNNNNTFDQDEFFYIGTGSDEVVNGSISIPAALADGSYRMRVRVAAVGSALATWDMSCNELQNFGETEDYTISVSQSSGYVYEDGMWTPWDPSGVATDSDNILVINGTTSLTLSTDVKNLTIMQGATLNITNVLGLYGDLIIDGDLIFVSNANGNGELGHVSGTSSIIGEATVQSYMSINRAYRMVSSAVSTITSVRANWQEGGINTNTGFGTHITGSQTGANGFDATATGNPSMFTVNEATQAFVAVSNTDQNTLGIGEPYLLFVRGDRSINLGDNTAAGETVLRAKGSLHVGPDLQAFATGAAEAFAMFGNPYQSAVDINSVFANASGNNVNTGHYYVYDPTQGTHGSYVTVDLPNALTTGTSTANQYLQPGQAAQFTTLNVGGSAVQFLESNKAPGNFTTTSATGNSLSADNMLTVQLFTAENFSNGGPTHDSFGIIFGEGLNNEVTSADARKPMNFYENLGRNHGGNFLSIERREMPMPAEVYPLYSTGYNYADYTLKMKVEGLTETVLYLDDHYTGISTLLEDGNTIYTFSVSTGDSMSIATDRFSIRTEARLDVESHDLLAGVRLFPNPLNDNTFYITAPKLNGEQISVSISDLRGRKIFEDMLDCRANTITVSVNEDIASGIYMVTMKHGGEEQTLRLVKK